jgi:hypothetical protein
MASLELSWLQAAPTILVVVVLFFLLIIFYILGHRLSHQNAKKQNDYQTEDLSAISGTLLGLLALLLAFTFGMSNARYDNRRNLIIEEANAIGTVILRTDLYPDSIRKQFRAKLKEYVEARIAFYEAGMEIETVVKAFLATDKIGKEVWAIAAGYAKLDPTTTKTAEMIPALNAMIDIVTTRRAAGESTIPDSIMYFLFVLSLCSAFLLGYDHKNKFDWIVVIGFALMLSLTIFTIIDMDRPRSGLIDMDVPNKKIKELREMFR